MKTHNTWKRICGMLLTLVLMIPAVTLPAFAEGSYTVSGTYKPEGVELDESTFDLYSVGTFGRSEDGSKSILVLDPVLKEKGFAGEVNLGIQRDSYADEEGKVDEDAWTEDWMTQAKTLADWLTVQETSPVEKRTTTTSGGEFYFSDVPNGLYLLAGGPRQKVKGEDGTSTYYFPRPMLVQVLNGNVELQVKTGTENVKDFTVVKKWSDEGHEALRPKSIDVDIYYGKELDRTITLGGDNPWSYSWETNKVDEEWRCIEKLSDEDSLNYACSTSEDTAGYMKTITLTNKYDRKPLTIVKKTNELYTASESSNIVAAFSLKGYVGDKLVYTGSASMLIEKEEQEIQVPAIPRKLTKLVVEEEYAGGNYTPVDKVKEATISDGEVDDEGNIVGGAYQVEFENKYNGGTVISGGIVNTFKQAGKDGFEIMERAGANADEQ